MNPTKDKTVGLSFASLAGFNRAAKAPQRLSAEPREIEPKALNFSHLAAIEPGQMARLAPVEQEAAAPLAAAKTPTGATVNRMVAAMARSRNQDVDLSASSPPPVDRMVSLMKKSRSA